MKNYTLLAVLLLILGGGLQAQINISSLNPDPVCAGSDLNVSGSGFSNLTSVVVGGIPANFVINSANSVTLTVSSQVAAGTRAVTLTDGITVATDSVLVNAQGDAYFSYPELNYCKNSANPIPDTISNILGTFSENTGSVFLNTVTGEIDLASSLVGGPFLINHTVGGPCPATYQTQVNIYLAPEPVLELQGGGTEICEGTNPVFVAQNVMTGVGNTDFFWYVNGILLKSGSENQFSPLSDVGLTIQNGDVIKVNAQFSPIWGGCSEVDSMTITVWPEPAAWITSYPHSLQNGDDLEVEYSVDVNNTNLNWMYFGTQNVTPNTQNGQAGSINFGQTGYLNTGSINLNELYPGFIIFSFTPVTDQGCVGETDTLSIPILPNQDLFVSELITPNGDGFNDTWMVILSDALNPTDYTAKIYAENGSLVQEISPLHAYWGAENLADGSYRYVISRLADGDLLAKGRVYVRRK
ncbi:MAG: gliding motility-associated C-terminal domain-containing protein [Bacteroidia bacterium]|nr:gliding motility-associated C-terminal domain-containing protein [Bacteroidia bacterium]